MNKDHQLALVDYLVVYSDVGTKFDPKTPEIVAIDEVSMDISYFGLDAQPAVETFKWSEIDDNSDVTVASMKDLKAKLVAMAKDAAKQQGYSHVTVRKYPETSAYTYFMVFLFAITVFGSYDMPLLKKLLLKDPMSVLLYSYLPELGRLGLDFIADHVRILGAILFGLHFAELIFVMIPATRRYRVGSARYAWWAVQFFEGFPAYMRFKKLVNE